MGKNCKSSSICYAEAMQPRQNKMEPCVPVYIHITQLVVVVLLQGTEPPAADCQLQEYTLPAGSDLQPAALSPALLGGGTTTPTKDALPDSPARPLCALFAGDSALKVCLCLHLITDAKTYITDQSMICQTRSVFPMPPPTPPPFSLRLCLSCFNF